MKDIFLYATISALFGLVALGLFFAQIVQYPYYSRLAKNNSIRILPIDGPRGTIYDRKGRALVTNKLAFDAAIVYQETKGLSKLQHILSETLGMSKEDVMKAVDRASRKPYAPMTVAEDIGKEKAMMLEEASFDVPGLIIQTRSRRSYDHGYVASHILGYLSEITENELAELKDYGYRKKHLLGRSGIEKYYDDYLSGVDGGLQVEVDSRGRQTRVLGIKEPSPGNDLYLTLDIDLQLVCDKLLGARTGAVIVMDPTNGEILALASHPAFDPNIFVRADASEERLKLLNDRVGRPLTNKAISGLYPPGSVFKLVTSAAALQSGRVTKATRYLCTGTYALGSAHFDCWKEDGHGSQNITEALTHSCNVFFYSIGRLIGVDPIEMYATAFGYGEKTGIDLPGEVKGVAPGRAWKKRIRKDNWYDGDTINYSIGQGYLIATPLQVLKMTAIVANNGNVVRPHLLRQAGDIAVIPPSIKKIPLDDYALKTIKDGMIEVINNPSGTGKRAKLKGVLAAGKTGTAQNPGGKTHAWFTGYAPADDPRIAVVAFLEHGGKGGMEPAEIAAGIFEEARNKGYIK